MVIYGYGTNFFRQNRLKKCKGVNFSPSEARNINQNNRGGNGKLGSRPNEARTYFNNINNKKGENRTW